MANAINDDAVLEKNGSHRNVTSSTLPIAPDKQRHLFRRHLHFLGENISKSGVTHHHKDINRKGFGRAKENRRDCFTSCSLLFLRF